MPSTRDQLLWVLHMEGAYCGSCDYDDAVRKHDNGTLDWLCRTAGNASPAMSMRFWPGFLSPL
jgi:hypothetical protein